MRRPLEKIIDEVHVDMTLPHPACALNPGGPRPPLVADLVLVTHIGKGEVCDKQLLTSGRAGPQLLEPGPVICVLEPVVCVVILDDTPATGKNNF